MRIIAILAGLVALAISLTSVAVVDPVNGESYQLYGNVAHTSDERAEILLFLGEDEQPLQLAFGEFSTTSGPSGMFSVAWFVRMPLDHDVTDCASGTPPIGLLFLSKQRIPRLIRLDPAVVHWRRDDRGVCVGRLSDVVLNVLQKTPPIPPASQP